MWFNSFMNWHICTQLCVRSKKDAQGGTLGNNTANQGEVKDIFLLIHIPLKLEKKDRRRGAVPQNLFKQMNSNEAAQARRLESDFPTGKNSNPNSWKGRAEKNKRRTLEKVSREEEWSSNERGGTRERRRSGGLSSRLYSDVRIAHPPLWKSQHRLPQGLRSSLSNPGLCLCVYTGGLRWGARRGRGTGGRNMLNSYSNESILRPGYNKNIRPGWSFLWADT